MISRSPNTKKYCKWFWDESLGGDFDAWGTSTYFMEFGDNLCAIRQIEVYAKNMYHFISMRVANKTIQFEIFLQL